MFYPNCFPFWNVKRIVSPLNKVVHELLQNRQGPNNVVEYYFGAEIKQNLRRSEMEDIGSSRPNISGAVLQINPKHSKDTIPPCARSGHCAVADDHNLYVFGGYNPDLRELTAYYPHEDDLFPLFRELWKYNFAANTWTMVETTNETPSQLASMSMILCGRFIVMYGGTGYPFGYTSTNQVRLFDTETKQWRTLLSDGQVREKDKDELPIRTYGQSISVVNNHLYVFGGTTGWDYNSDVHRVNMQTEEWEQLFNYEKFLTGVFTGRMGEKKRETQANIPQSRYRHEMLCDGDRLYIIGGGTSRIAFPLDLIHAFNLSSMEWEKVQSIPDPKFGHPAKRRCHGCDQLGSDGYITGGYDGEKIHDDIWKLSLPTLQWTKLAATLPEPVYFHASAITPSGCLYYHGGVTSPPGDKRTNKLNCVWVKPPSLMQLSWYTVLACIPDIEELPRETLLGLGVPHTLLKSLGADQE